MSNIPSQKLNTGAAIPGIALGTWESSEKDTYIAVTHALKSGYRHIDTAFIYGNEESVGRAIRDSGIPREELFITTKAWCNNFDNVAAALDESLRLLGLEYVDLYLMHWPFAIKDGKLDKENDFVKVWEQFQKLDKNKARAIGVSNFDITNLTKLLEAPTTTIIPATNQVELHVNLNQQALVDFCHSKNIVVEAYSPLGRGDLENPTIKKIAEKHNTSPATVVLSWGIGRNTVVLPKSVTPSRIESNLAYVQLDKDDLAAITDIQKNTKLIRHCNFGDGFNVDVFHGDADALKST